jgi:hypothetical protein
MNASPFDSYRILGTIMRPPGHSGKLLSMQPAESEPLTTRESYSFSIITRSSSLDFPSFF